MKKILLSISFVVCFFAGFSQSIVQRSTGANTLVDPNLFTSKSFRPPVFADTTAANAITSLDSCGKVIFTYSGMTLWVRACSPKRWIQVGRNVSFENSPSITFSGTGETNDPVVANVIVSAQANNALQINPDGVYVQTAVINGLNSGGVVTNVEGGYTYDVSAAQFAIGGIQYNTPYTQLTLPNSDPTFDRFDAIVANTNGTITSITGTPAEDPLQPSVDVTTQLPLAFILVTANTVAPTIPQVWIYENYPTIAWTTDASTVRINRASTNNPYSVPTDVEGTLVQNADNIRFTTIDAFDISDYNILTFKIFSKAVWANTSQIIIQFCNSSVTPVGLSVSLANNAYSFQSSQISSYQTISIPLSSFGSIADATNLLMTVSTLGGATIGFYIDDIQLQESVVPSVSYTASNGLTMVGTDTRLGGPLTAPTTITMGATNTLSLTASSPSILTSAFSVTNTTGAAIRGQSTSSIGVTGIAGNSSFPAVQGSNSGSGPGGGFTTVGVSTTTVLNTLTVGRASFSTPGVGMGSALAFFLAPSNTPTVANNISNRIISKWTDPTFTSTASQLIITGVTANTESDLFTLSGNGQLKLNKYVTSAFTSGTATQILGTTSDGTVIQISTAGVSTPTLQQVITAGATLLSNNTIAGGGFNFAITNAAVSMDAPSGNYMILQDGGGDMIFSGQSGEIRLTTSGTGNDIHVSVGAGTFEIFGETLADDIFQRAGKRIEVGANASDLSTPVNGQIYYNSVTNKFRAYENGGWVNMITAGGSPMTNPMNAIGQLIVSADGSGTPTVINPGTAGYVLTSNGAGAVPTYQLITGTGTVTNTTGTANQIAVATGTTTPVISLVSGGTLPGAWILGTPASVTLTNATGLPVSTGISGLGSNVATFLATPSSANLAAAITDESGSGALVFATSPTLVTPALGTPSALVGTNITGTAAAFTSGITLGLKSATTTVSVSAATAPTTGQVLVATSSTTATWQTLAPVSGVVSLAGTINQVTVNGTTGTPQTGVLTIAAAQDIHTSAIPTFRGATFSGGSAGAQVISLSSTAVSVGILNGIDLSPTASGSAHIYQSTSNQIIEPSSGTASLYTTMYLGITTVTAGAGLVDNTASLYIQGSMAGVVNGGNYSMWVDAGPVRIDDIGPNRIVQTNASGVLVPGINPNFQTLTDGATIVWNVSDGSNAVVTLAGTGRTLTILNPVAGQTYIIRIIQGSGGSKTITTWPTNTKWANGTAPTLSTTAGDYDIITFLWDGTNYYAIPNYDFSFIDINKERLTIPMYNEDEDFKQAA